MGILIAAAKSGSGKTTIVCALLEALKTRGMSPCAFKCGPDYIDPMFHKEIIGVPSYNLDSYFLDAKSLRELYARRSAEGDISVAEGAMGLYDGLGGISVSGSAYDIACVLDLPVILVIDAHGMGRSLAALIRGFLEYDSERKIAGIILNRVSDRFYERIAPVIEDECGVPVLGHLPKSDDFVIESRHLGLKLPWETDDLKKHVADAAALLEKCVDIDKIIDISRGGSLPELCVNRQAIEDGKNQREKTVGAVKAGNGADKVKIALARDEAFCFYYEENLRLLELLGAELVPFSPIRDKKLPDDVSGVYFGGGYPELYAAQLENNISMRSSIGEALAGGMPSVAECGGFMYLHRFLKTDEGKIYKMCGVLPGTCYYTGGLAGFGYVELREKKETFMGGVPIRGHEFHYFDSENGGTDCVATKPIPRASRECAYMGENHFWGFAHLYWPSNPEFARHFTDEAAKYKRVHQ